MSSGAAIRIIVVVVFAFGLWGSVYKKFYGKRSRIDE